MYKTKLHIWLADFHSLIKKKKEKRRGYHFYKLGILIAVHCWALGHDGNTVFTYVQSQRKRVTVKTLKQEHKDLHEEYSVTQHHRLEEEWIYYHVIPSLKSGKTIYTPHTTLVDGLYDTEGTCENNMKQRRYTLVWNGDPLIYNSLQVGAIIFNENKKTKKEKKSEIVKEIAIIIIIFPC